MTNLSNKLISVGLFTVVLIWVLLVGIVLLDLQEKGNSQDNVTYSHQAK